MKKFFISILMPIFLISCSDHFYLEEEHLSEESRYDSPLPEEPEERLKEIKVLLIGNSFTEDAFSYVPSLFSEGAPEVDFVFGIAYRGGSCLTDHYASLTNSEITIGNSSFKPDAYVFNVSTNTAISWERSWGLSITDILTYTDWDIITFQQGGAHAAFDYGTYYEPFLEPLINLVKENTSYDTKIGWVSIHGCYHISDVGLRERWYDTTVNTRNVMENNDISLLFPFGTAVQNLRDCVFIENKADNLGWMVDNGHLQDGLGCLTAAYANTLVLLDYCNYSPQNLTFEFVPTAENLVELNIPGMQLGENGVVGICPDYCEAGLEAAKAAVRAPYVVTNIEDMLGIDTPMAD